jgi:hypothetical protein
MRLLRAAILVAVSAAYWTYAFQLTRGDFWNAGLGDWQDPYFINGLLEHWAHALGTLTDPASPPVYFPARKTLGYSHGLVLYVPFYVPLRTFLHPFLAYNLTVLLVMQAGVVCLYVVLRRIGLSLVESLLLTIFFFTSQNVINETTGIWTQRASVFLIPPVLLLVLVSMRRPDGWFTRVLAALSGLLATLLYTQDFYTAHFAMAFAVVFGMAAVMVSRPGRIRAAVAAYWSSVSAPARVVLVIALLTAAWACAIWTFGGFDVRVAGFRISSNDWRRPALAAVAVLAVYLWLRGGVRRWPRLPVPVPWAAAFALGATLGGCVFLWIYLDAFRAHPAFPEQNLLDALALRDPAGWSGPWDVVRSLGAYYTLRSFTFALALGVLAWVPWFESDRNTRRYWLWILAVSIVVLLIPVRYGDASGSVSIWRLVFEWLPGFGVIRDPKRGIYLYELGLVLASALVLARVSVRSALRRCAVPLLVVLLVAAPNREVLGAWRPIATYARWVEAPVTIDASCRSFVMRAAGETYRSRSSHAWTLYAVDATFIALARSIPTLNGYSAWFPEGWDLMDPHGAGYDLAVRRWIARHGLRGVCELDIDARTMTPITP